MAHADKREGIQICDVIKAMAQWHRKRRDLVCENNGDQQVDALLSFDVIANLTQINRYVCRNICKQMLSMATEMIFMQMSRLFLESIHLFPLFTKIHKKKNLFATPLSPVSEHNAHTYVLTVLIGGLTL